MFYFEKLLYIQGHPYFVHTEAENEKEADKILKEKAELQYEMDVKNGLYEFGL